TRHSLPDILDLHDAAFGLLVLWILYHRHVQFLFIFAERNVCRAITCGNFKDVEQLPVRRDLQNLATEPLGHIDVALLVDLHAIRSNPPGIVLIPDEKVEQSKIGPVTSRAVVVDRELQDAISNRFADVESLLVGRDAYSIRVIEIVCHFHPFLTARREIKNFPNYRGWYRWIAIWTKDRRISTAVSGHHDIIYSPLKLPAIAVGIPSAQLFPGHVEFQDYAGIVSAREQECLLF